MVLKKKKYTILDIITIVFETAPLLCTIKILIAVFTGIQPALQVIYTARFIQSSINIANGTQSVSEIYSPLIVIILLVASNYLLSGSIIQVISVKLKLELFKKFRMAITQRRAQLDYYYTENNDTYDLIRRVSDDPAVKIKNAFDTFMWLANMLLNIISVIVLMVVHLMGVAFIILGISIPILYFALKNGKLNYEGYKESSKFARRYEYLSEVLTQRDAVDERTLFGFTPAMSDKYLSLFEKAKTILFKTFRHVFKRTFISDMSTIVLSITISIMMLTPVLSGQLSFAMYVSLVGAVFSLVQYTARRIPRQVSKLTESSGYMRDLTRFCALDTIDGADSLPKHPVPKLLSISFRDVHFHYPGTSHAVLNGISFEMKAGRHYALVGANGSGKSTIVKLLTGLYKNYSGEVLINNRELRTIPKEELKAYFSVVYQDFARYSITLDENIALGAGCDMDVQMPDICAAKKLLSIDEIANELPLRNNTILGKAVSEGQDLSGGQWQRVALARAVANPAPMKILDEPTAALDPISESNIYKQFEEISKNNTTLFISHRLGSTKLADEIIVLDNGSVKEYGTHKELMENMGLYAEMFDSQRSWYE